MVVFATREHGWLVFYLPTTTSRSFCAKLLSRWLARAHTGLCGYSFTGASLCISICWTAWDSCWAIFPACWGPSEWHHNHLVYQLLFLVLCHLWTFWGSTLPHCPSHWWRYSTALAPGPNPRGHHQQLVPSCTLCQWSQPLELSSSVSLQSTSLSIYLVCTSSVCLWGCFRKDSWKPH